MKLLDFLKPKSEAEKLLYEAKKLRSSNGRDPLYQFEHISFRKLFFEMNNEFVESLINKDNFPFFVYANQCNLMKQPIKYSKEQFVLTAYCNDSKQIVFRLIPPEPYVCPLCYEIRMIVDPDGNALKYETLEKDMKSSTPVLCQWDKDETHYNLGPVNNDYYNMPLQVLDIKIASNFSDLKLQINTPISVQNTKTNETLNKIDDSRINEDKMFEDKQNPVDSRISNSLVFNDFEKNLINDYFNYKSQTEGEIQIPEIYNINEEAKASEKEKTSRLPNDSSEDFSNLATNMKFCRYCGSKLVVNAAFCHRCGKKIQ